MVVLSKYQVIQIWVILVGVLVLAMRVHWNY